MIDRLARAKQRHRERSIPSNTWERETDRQRERERERESTHMIPVISI